MDSGYFRTLIILMFISLFMGYIVGFSMNTILFRHIQYQHKGEQTVIIDYTASGYVTNVYPTTTYIGKYTVSGTITTTTPKYTRQKYIFNGTVSTTIPYSYKEKHVFYGYANTTIARTYTGRFNEEGVSSVYLGGNYSIQYITVYSNVGENVCIINEVCVLEVLIWDPWGWRWVDQLVMSFNNTAVYVFNKSRLVERIDPFDWFSIEDVLFMGAGGYATYIVYFKPTPNLGTLLQLVIQANDFINNYTTTTIVLLDIVHSMKHKEGMRVLGGIASEVSGWLKITILQALVVLYLYIMYRLYKQKRQVLNKTLTTRTGSNLEATIKSNFYTRYR
ncbi:hypothetical protein J4526_05965 [Desulfurococcaceae archaeon MEX13E-LK6-19]|nr:hypothetical protein J4526_05965 [Desulfurococcaceae archaeon MEX13E-LK6-19]